MPSRSAGALSNIGAAMTKPPSVSRGLRGGVFLRSRARDCSFSLFISRIVPPRFLGEEWPDFGGPERLFRSASAEWMVWLRILVQKARAYRQSLNSILDACSRRLSGLDVNAKPARTTRLFPLFSSTACFPPGPLVNRTQSSGALP